MIINLLIAGCATNGNLIQPDSTLNNFSATAVSDVTYESEGSEKLNKTPTISPTAIADSTPTQIPSTATPLVQSTPVDFGSASQETAQILQRLIPPVRDDARLARAFGVDTGNRSDNREPSDLSLEVGALETFNILNVVDNTVGVIQAELLAVSDHAYFWFDQDLATPRPSEEELLQSAQAFDEIYDVVVEQFGSENNPGIDGDPRLHIVNASPMALCGVTEETADQCYLAGLVQPADLLPRSIDPRSNEREMFVMNGHRFGGSGYLGVLAHEFRHMIEDNYDISDADWEKEGSATLSAELAGYPSGGIQRGNMFLENPDQQLNSWTEENTAPFYGQGYLFNRYIFDQLGEDLYYQFATSPLPGLHALDSVAGGNDLNFDGLSLWLDWLVALAVHDHANAPQEYQFENAGINTAALTSFESLPAGQKETVHQFAADFYQLPRESGILTFQGSPEVSLINAAPTSGERFWYSQRGNNSNPRLTREIDLTPVSEASLLYNVFADIEQGYDFAYVSVSTDGGESWIALAGEHMQGLDSADNPANSAFTERFYSARTKQWMREQIDLTPYAGQKILLRFEYVTDPILTYAGIAIDDISIPEIGLFDDVEQEDSAWEIEGFVRATEYLPQIWHLRLITFEDNQLIVEDLKVDPNGQLTQPIDSQAWDRNAILIIAATAPTTLEAAEYSLRVDSSLD